MQLIRRIPEGHQVACPSCGAAMRILALIAEAAVSRKIVRHVATKGADQRSPLQESTAAT